MQKILSTKATPSKTNVLEGICLCFKFLYFQNTVAQEFFKQNSVADGLVYALRDAYRFGSVLRRVFYGVVEALPFHYCAKKQRGEEVARAGKGDGAKLGPVLTKCAVLRE